MYFKVNSKESLDEIAFHDCIINRVEWQDTTLLLYFEWLDIFKTHPENCTGKAKRVDNAVVLFDNAKILKCIRFDFTRAFEEGKKIGKQHYTDEDADIIDCNLMELCDNGLEISYATIELRKAQKIWVCSCQYEEFEIEHSCSTVCWNDFNGDAWFEGWPDNIKN